MSTCQRRRTLNDKMSVHFREPRTLMLLFISEWSVVLAGRIGVVISVVKNIRMCSTKQEVAHRSGQSATHVLTNLQRFRVQRLDLNEEVRLVVHNISHRLSASFVYI